MKLVLVVVFYLVMIALVKNIQQDRSIEEVRQQCVQAQTEAHR